MTLKNKPTQSDFGHFPHSEGQPVLHSTDILGAGCFKGCLGGVQEGLKRLWEHAFPGVPWQGVQADKWVDMGWQRNDPSSDFRGAGLIALHNHLHMAQVSPSTKTHRNTALMCHITVCADLLSQHQRGYADNTCVCILCRVFGNASFVLPA